MTAIPPMICLVVFIAFFATLLPARIFLVPDASSEEGTMPWVLTLPGQEAMRPDAGTRRTPEDILGLAFVPI
jgi:hypothetical protein